MSEDQEVVIDTSTSLLISTLEKRWKTYRSELKRCYKEPSEEAVHDLRVAARRLVALVDMLREFDPHPRLQKLRQIIKNQLEGLDDLRDIQVMLVEVTEVLNDLPELVAFQEYLLKREKRLMRSTTKGIKSFKLEGVRKRLDATRNALFREKDTKNQEKELLQIVDESFETALRKFRRIEPAHPATLHRLRVVFKKFRYMVEIVHPLISNFPTEKFKDMHDYQGLLGDIHDLEIFISAFEDFAGNDTSYDPEPVSQFYKQRHSEVTNAFIEDMQHINTFWRSTPDSPFPWEVERKLESSVLPKKPSASLPVQKKDGNGKQVAAGLEA